MNYVIYKSTGEILRTVSCPPSMISVQLGPDEFFLKGTANDTLEYVGSGQVLPRREIDSVITGQTITQLPVPSTVYVDGQRFEVTDGEFEFTIDQPGTYEIRIEVQNRMPKVFDVTV